ncbi:MAG TPA: TonB-dependent receptor [Rhizomicrobium sp.]
MYRLSAAILIVVLWPLAASAGPVETVVVTATRLPQGAVSSAANVAVIDADDIAARDPSSVTELLRGLPGIHVQQAGGRGSVVSVFTRGAKPNFTLVLIDGVKTNDPTNTRGGSFDFSSLDLADIARVEFVRGPASAIYGSDAIGGVIAIATRRGGAAPEAGLEAEGGQYGFWRVAGRAGGPVAAAMGSIGASYTDNGMPVAGSTFRGANFDGTLDLPPFAGVTLALAARYGIGHATSFPDSSGGPRLAVLRRLDRRDIGEAVFSAGAARAMRGDWTMTLDYGLYDRHALATSPGVAASAFTPSGIPPNGDRVHFQRHEVTWVNRLALGRIDVAAGAEALIERGVDDGFLQFGPFPLPTHFALDRTTPAAFAEARIEIADGLHLEASGRYDWPSSAKGRFSPQLRADETVAATGGTIVLAWGRGFKQPSFYALGNPIVGDPALRPETAENLEADVSQPFGTHALGKLALFDTHYVDLIDFQPGAVPKLVNLSRAHVRGIEVSVDLTFDALTLSPHVSYDDARNTQSGAHLRDVPMWLAGGTLLWRFAPDATFSLDVTTVGSLTDNAIPTGDVTLPAHTRADIAVAWRFAPTLALHVGVENVFDARYEDVVGFPAPGALLRAGLRASL